MEAAALELEDDVFFKDLSRQISLLIMDDDEDSLAHCPSVFNQAIHPATHATFLNYNRQSSKRERKGTGVFIPRSTNSRSNIKQRRFTASGNTFQRPSDHNSRGLPHVAYGNTIDPSLNHSFNPRRF